MLFVIKTIQKQLVMLLDIRSQRDEKLIWYSSHLYLIFVNSQRLSPEFLYFVETFLNYVMLQTSKQGCRVLINIS